MEKAFDSGLKRCNSGTSKNRAIKKANYKRHQLMREKFVLSDKFDIEVHQFQAPATKQPDACLEDYKYLRKQIPMWIPKSIKEIYLTHDTGGRHLWDCDSNHTKKHQIPSEITNEHCRA